MALTREQTFARIDELEGWGRALGQISHGAIVGTLLLAIGSRLVHAVFGSLLYFAVKLVEMLVERRVRLHIRRLGLTK